MSWTDLGKQFGLELAFGVLLALAFVPRAPVGHLFYRVMAGTAAAGLLLAGFVSVRADPTAWSRPEVLASGLALLLLPTYARMPNGRAFWFGLGLAALAAAFAVAATLRHALSLTALPDLVAGTVTALATGAVAGSVGLAMVLGHWYLTVPKLAIEHLARLNRLSLWTMLFSALSIGLSAALFGDRLAASGRDLLGAWGLFHLGTRVAVGLALPALFGWMTASSLRYHNTRSATGILYASTVLVLIGTAASLWLQDSYRVPL